MRRAEDGRPAERAVPSPAITPHKTDRSFHPDRRSIRGLKKAAHNPLPGNVLCAWPAAPAALLMIGDGSAVISGNIRA